MPNFLNCLHNVVSCLPKDVLNVKNDGGGGHEEKCSHGHPDEVALQHQALPPVARVHLEEGRGRNHTKNSAYGQHSASCTTYVSDSRVPILNNESKYVK